MTDPTTATRVILEETYRGHEIRVTERDVPPSPGGSTTGYTLRTAYIDGRGFRCPVGSPEQVAKKLRKHIDTDIADAELLPRLLELVNRGGVPLGPDEAPHIDQAVHVHAMGRYRCGLVTKLGKSRAEVAYTTTASSGGRVYRKNVSLESLRIEVAR